MLLADDLPQIRNVLRRILERDPRFEVVGEATNGTEAIELAGSHQPNALVLDLSMPGMSGLEALPKILEASPDTKIIVLSGSTEMAPDVLLAGAHGFFEKTAPAHELATTIAKLVGGSGDDN